MTMHSTVNIVTFKMNVIAIDNINWCWTTLNLHTTPHIKLIHGRLLQLKNALVQIVTL